jgi:hypothetical protein
LVVPSAYFRREAGLFLDQDELARRWQKQRRLDYLPIVDVRVMKGVKAPINADGRKSLREAVKYDTKPQSLVVSRGGRPILVGAEHEELYDIGDGRGLQPHRYVPLRAVLDSTKHRRMLSMSANLQGDDLELELGEFPEDVEGNGEQQPADLGAFLYTEIYAWRVRGFDADFFLVGRTFDEPKGRLAMPP